MSQHEIRSQAYQFIQQILAKQPLEIHQTDSNQIILLDDLVKLKAGLVDPTPALISALKELFPHGAEQNDINTYLVFPFSDTLVTPADNSKER